MGRQVSHGDFHQRPDTGLSATVDAFIAAIRAAARKMASGYDIVYPPELTTRHTERSAIDMTISGVKNKKIKNASDIDVLIKKDSDLHAVGATYGVNKLVSDPPHWSDNGH
jgi:hypothetical protein